MREGERLIDDYDLLTQITEDPLYEEFSEAIQIYTEKAYSIIDGFIDERDEGYEQALDREISGLQTDVLKLFRNLNEFPEIAQRMISYSFSLKIQAFELAKEFLDVRDFYPVIETLKQLKYTDDEIAETLANDQVSTIHFPSVFSTYFEPKTHLGNGSFPNPHTRPLTKRLGCTLADLYGVERVHEVEDACSQYEGMFTLNDVTRLVKEWDKLRDQPLSWSLEIVRTE